MTVSLVRAVLDDASFQHLVEDSIEPMLILAADEPRSIIYANAALLEMLGYAAATEILGRSAFACVDEHDRDRLCVDGPQVLRWLRLNGTRVPVRTRMTPIEFDGEPAVLVTGCDLERERCMRSTEERSRVLFDSPLPMWVFDRETFAYIDVNDAAVKLYGYTREEFLRMNVSDIKPREDMPAMQAAVAITDGRRAEKVGIKRHLAKDGRVLEIDVTGHSLEYEGRPALLAIGVDVTEARELEEQLRQSQKLEAIGQLAGGVAHDFNNIIGVILGNAELALDDATATRSVAEELREIEAAAQRAASLTQQLLAFSRQQPRVTTAIRLDRVVGNLEKMLSRIVGENIAIRTAFAPQLGVIIADVGQLEQVIVNLVVNARDAMPTGGRLAIETDNIELDAARAAVLGVRAGAYVMLSVSDTGCGMDAATRARIFEPFFTTKDVGKGSGLGLSTVFGIVTQSGGGIAVDSELRRGTRVDVFLPRATGEEYVAMPHAIPHGGGSETVLVVEDDSSLRNVIRRHLRAFGYTSIEVSHADAALDLVRHSDTTIDLVLTDMVMPGIDGRALAAAIATLRPNLPVLYMSGYPQHAAVTTGALGSGDHFIEKPFTAAKLSLAIRRAIGG